MSANRFAEAEAAFQAGRGDEGKRLTADQLNADPDAPAPVYRSFGAILVRDRDYAQAESVGRRAVERHPRDPELWNILGVALRRLKRYPEAIEALEKAARLSPRSDAIQQNLGNVFNDARDARAIKVFSQLVRSAPSNAEHQRQLGRAHWFAKDFDKAIQRLNLATRMKPDMADAWLDLSAAASDARGPVEGLEALDRGLKACPGDARLQEARLSMLRRSGRMREAEQLMLDMLKVTPDAAWLHFQLAGALTDYDRARANEHFRRAIELAPDNVDYRITYAESLGRDRTGDEGGNLETAYRTMVEVLDQAELTPGNLKVIYELLVRVADYDRLEALGSFSKVGRTWAEAGRHTALMAHLARVRTEEDRLELVEQHRIWGRLADAAAVRRPITHPAPRAPGGKIRVGYMSSDLRGHPVAYFALPLFEHYDRSRFEVFCYSWYQGEEDPTQKQISQWVDGFRWHKDITDREAAQLIADDNLDMLFELGATTHMNKLSVMSYRPAPRQASWVGYPHSAGPETIDYLVLDPWMNPPDPRMVIEKPLLLAHTWYAMGERAFREQPAVDPVAPVERNGFITFGTANNPYKYTRETVAAWARAVAGTPGSKFMFVRPEGTTPTFTANIRAVFESQGVSADRVVFETVRGRHLPFYNQMDISLDTFPQTGGTTTCESLWMGVPVVARVGDAVFERMSYSILNNAGLGDLVGRTTDEYVDIAVRLAADPARIGDLRRTLRDRLAASPLRDARGFSADWHAMVERAMAEPVRK